MLIKILNYDQDSRIKMATIWKKEKKEKRNKQKKLEHREHGYDVKRKKLTRISESNMIVNKQWQMTKRDCDSLLDEKKPLGKRIKKKLIDFTLPIRENEKSEQSTD